MIPVPLFDLKFLVEFAAGTSQELQIGGTKAGWQRGKDATPGRFRQVFPLE
jgi:hypothetical protein